MSGTESHSSADQTAKPCPDCEEVVKAEARVCRFCSYRFDAEASPPALSHEEQVAILRSAIAQCAKDGWKVSGQQPASAYEVCLSRKSGLTAREFMALWVEEDGEIKTNYVGEGGRMQIIPFVFLPLN